MTLRALVLDDGAFREGFLRCDLPPPLLRMAFGWLFIVGGALRGGIACPVKEFTHLYGDGNVLHIHDVSIWPISCCTVMDMPDLERTNEGTKRTCAVSSRILSIRA